MTADHIDFHASERPGAVAVVHDGRAILYARFARDVGRFVAAVRGFGLRRGSIAAVQCADPYGHWLILLACERLGIVTASLAAGEGPGVLPLLAGADLALTEQPLPQGIATPRQAVTQQWLADVLARADPPDEVLPPKRADDPVRITRTSGTTGEQKRLLYTRSIVNARTVKRQWVSELNRRTRYLAQLPFSIESAYLFACAVVRSCGTVVFESRLPVWQAIGSYGITHGRMLPSVLGQTIEELPHGFVKPPQLRIDLMGGAAGPALYAKAMMRFATEIAENYSTNEAGTVATTLAGDPRCIGVVRPGAEVEIVDAAMRPLPLGEAGVIRVRTQEMVTSYLDDPEASRSLFRDGWFHTGDLGLLHAPRRLQLLGRADEALNIGGVKLMPARLEEELRQALQNADVAVTTIADADGIDEICIAVSGPPDPNRQDRLARAVRDLPLARINVVALDAIPRTETGKIRRAELKAMIARMRRVAQE
jgi:acyl-CoA synthetase (AMP-forming)/AMP-acid ligase II